MMPTQERECGQFYFKTFHRIFNLFSPATFKANLTLGSALSNRQSYTKGALNFDNKNILLLSFSMKFMKKFTQSSQS